MCVMAHNADRMIVFLARGGAMTERRTHPGGCDLWLDEPQFLPAAWWIGPAQSAYVRTSTKWPSMAAAAAMMGETRCVRPL